MVLVHDIYELPFRSHLAESYVVLNILLHNLTRQTNYTDVDILTFLHHLIDLRNLIFGESKGVITNKSNDPLVSATFLFKFSLPFNCFIKSSRKTIVTALSLA